MARCKVCRSEFTRRSMTHKACSPECALELAKQAREKADRKKTRDRLEQIKPRSQWLKEAQTAFNAWVRKRDHDLPCISCGRHHTGQYHAGHYLSTGARPELRFDPDNVHKQCSVCNNHLSGNLVRYRIALIEKIGLDRVEWLEGSHPPKKYTIDDLRDIRDNYRAMVKSL